MNDLSKLAIPRVNMNGASRNVLLADLAHATDALRKAYVALSECEYSHGREFQTVGDPAIGRLAQDQHRARLQAILDVKAELNYLAEQIYAQ